MSLTPEETERLRGILAAEGIDGTPAEVAIHLNAIREDGTTLAHQHLGRETSQGEMEEFLGRAQPMTHVHHHPETGELVETTQG